MSAAKSSIRRAHERDECQASNNATAQEVHGRIVSGRHDASCLGRPLSLVVAQDTVHGAAIRRSSDDEEVVAGSQLCGAAGRDQASISRDQGNDGAIRQVQGLDGTAC